MVRSIQAVWLQPLNWKVTPSYSQAADISLAQSTDTRAIRHVRLHSMINKLVATW